MKKLISLLLVLVMVAAMAAGCNKAPAKTPLADNMETVANKIIEQKPVEFMGGTMPVDLTDADAVSYFTGLSGVDKVKEAVVFEPMMGSIAFSMVLVRVNDAADAKTVAQEMTDNIDTRKWICVEANDKLVAGYSDTVMLIMVDSNNGMTAQSFVDAFKTVCGSDLDFTI